MEVVIGTGNPGKLKEYRRMLADLSVELLGLHDVGLGDMDVEETGDTFRANAELKALAYAKACGKFVIADDSGLCVDALNGEPGVLSARYGGSDLDDAGRRSKLLDALKDTPENQRNAHFECVIAIADPEKNTCLTTSGVCQGMITPTEQNGEEGFGYDALFQPSGYNQTFAQLEKDTKNRLSHRGEAVRQLIPILQSIIREQSI